MLPILFPLVSVVLAQPASPRVAQVELAEALASADSIDGVAIQRDVEAPRHRATIDFTIARDHRAYHVRARTVDGEVVDVHVDATAASAAVERGPLSWLAPELADAAAIVSLTVDRDARVAIHTDDARVYLAIPDRGTATAAEARWAAAWDGDA